MQNPRTRFKNLNLVLFFFSFNLKMPGVTLSWESINMSYISERLARIQSAVAFLDHSSQFHAIRDRAKELSNLKVEE